MWLTSFLNKGKAVSGASKGSVTLADERKLEIDSATQHRDVSVVAPYGIAYVPPLGKGAVVVPFDGGEACVGVVTSYPEKLKRGELMLYSSGGASIVLKNDGCVYINGKKVGD